MGIPSYFVHIVKNHGNVFWETLEKVCENSKRLDRELKNYNLSIF